MWPSHQKSAIPAMQCVSRCREGDLLRPDIGMKYLSAWILECVFSGLLSETVDVDISDALLRQSLPLPVLSRRGAGPHPQEGRRQGDRVQHLRPQAGGAAVLSSVWDGLRQGNTTTSPPNNTPIIAGKDFGARSGNFKLTLNFKNFPYFGVLGDILPVLGDFLFKRDL